MSSNPSPVDLVFRKRRLPALLVAAKGWGWSMAALAHVVAISWVVEHIPEDSRHASGGPTPVKKRWVALPAIPNPPAAPKSERPAETEPAAKSVEAPTEAPIRVKAQRRRVRTSRGSKPGPAQVSAAAQAARVVKASKQAPVDLTGTAFVTGSARQYAGGVSHANGRSKQKVRGSGRGNASPRPARRSKNLRRPVRWAGSRQWVCPWPTAAMEQEIYQQEVVIRVRVLADGRVKRVHIHRDPGWGFGEAARRCASQLRFQPALDDRGRAVVALSPPIRVRFRR